MATIVPATVTTAPALHRHTGMVWPALLWPVGWALTAAAMLRSWWLVHARRGVTWRGAFYSLEDLPEARRTRGARLR